MNEWLHAKREHDSRTDDTHDNVHLCYIHTYCTSLSVITECVAKRAIDHVINISTLTYPSGYGFIQSEAKFFFSFKKLRTGIPYRNNVLHTLLYNVLKWYNEFMQAPEPSPSSSSVNNNRVIFVFVRDEESPNNDVRIRLVQLQNKSQYDAHVVSDQDIMKILSKLEELEAPEAF